MLCSILKTFSQNISINKGTIIKDRQFLIDKKEVTACDNRENFISIRPHRVNGTLRNYYIEFFNDLNFIERQEIETENSTKILDIFIKNNKAHILVKEDDGKKISIRFDLFDLQEKKLGRKTLIKAEKETQKELFNALKNDSFIAFDHTNDFLLSFPVIENTSSYTYLEFFDANLNSISKHSIYPNKEIHKKNIALLNVSRYHDKILMLYSISDKKSGHYYQLIEFYNNKTRDIILPIKDHTYQLINTKIIDENLIISGLFSKQKKGAFEGTVYYNVNLETFELNSNKLSNFISEAARKYFAGLFKKNRSIDINDVFIDDNNNTFFLGQCYTIRKQHVPIGIPLASFATSSFTAFITYNPISISQKIYDDLLIAKINPDGQLIWDHILEMQQTEKITSKSNKKDSSYFAFLDQSQLHILMNGYINMDKEEIVMKQNIRNSKTNFYDITINSEGHISPNIIFKNSDSEILFRAEDSVKHDNIIFNLGQGNMRKQLLKLVLF